MTHLVVLALDANWESYSTPGFPDAVNLFLMRAQYNSYADSAHAAAVLKGFSRQDLSGNGLTDVTPLADLLLASIHRLGRTYGRGRG